MCCKAFLIVPLFAAYAMQTKPPAAPPVTTALPKALVEVVDRARSVPAEFGADSLLRIAESNSVAGADARRELIEEAFRLAGAAEEPMKRRSPRPGSADTSVNFRARAFAQDLDALTLRSRAVADMLRVDKRRARELFSRIPPPRVPRLACGDLLVYDVSPYYELLPDLAGSVFTAKERAQEEHVKFLAALAGRISSPAEVGPMAAALAKVTVTPNQLQELSTVFSAALKDLLADDRSFSYTVSSQGTMMTDVGALVATAKRQKVSTMALVDAVRGYLVRHLSAKRCWDTGGPTITAGIGGANPMPEQPDAVTFFNDRLRVDVYPPEAVIAPLAGEEIRAAGLEDSTPPEETAWKGAGVQDLVDRYNGLLFDPLGTPWSSEQKSETAWQSRLREYLTALADWKPTAEMSAAEYFYRKCYLLGSLINVVPNGPPRELVLHGYLDFLQQNSYQQVKRTEWFLPVNILLLRVSTDPALASLAAEMRGSGDAVIALYAQLDTLLPRSPGKVMGLL